MIRKIILILLGLALLGVAAVGFVGVRRYGSIEGLVRRVQIEVSSLQPRPTVLPTVVPRATVDLAQVAALLEPTPTIRPTETLPPTNTPVAEIEIETPTVSPDLPTAEPTPTPTPEPTAIPIFAPAADQVYLEGYRHNWQGWNNCAPATLATYLSFWDLSLTQDEAAAGLKPNEFDKNVSPAEVAALAQAEGMQTQWMVNGDVDTLKLLLSNGVPVMIETWLEPEPNDGMGHYRLVVGYEEAVGEWIVSDSFVSKDVELPYRGIRLPEEAFDETWRVFLNTMIVAYPAEKAELVDAILEDRSNPEVMWQQAFESIQIELAEDPQDGVLWHSLGRILWELEQPEQAVAAFDQARALGIPWRTFWYQFEAFEAYLWAERPEEVLALTQATIDSGGGGEEVYYWKGMAHEQLGQTAEAASAWRNAVWWHPQHQPSMDKLAGSS